MWYGHGRTGHTSAYSPGNRLHTSSGSSVVTQVEARRQNLRCGGRCYVYLRRGYLSCECRSRLCCSACKGSHHLSICERKSEASPPSKTTPSSNMTGGPPLNPGVQPFSGVALSGTSAVPSGTSTLYAGSSRIVLLQTAVTEVSNP